MDRKRVLTTMWRYKMILWIIFVVVGVYLDFLHIMVWDLKQHNMTGFGYGAEISFTRIKELIVGLFTDLINYIKSLF